MEFNWTVVTVVGALLAQGAAIVWAVSSMVQLTNPKGVYPC